ncbi:hypothetical protein A4A49_41883 [Nicotiana attenuata]|uniref:Uncharacterized protein n=1 Tax=Nicotiana attenuata TaxID=49451 RepID=A0A1J6IQ35_NICAT|nr:hypothetical protein A4A49_41883 [Nicotiana attenuata]
MVTELMHKLVIYEASRFHFCSMEKEAKNVDRLHVNSPYLCGNTATALSNSYGSGCKDERVSPASQKDDTRRRNKDKGVMVLISHESDHSTNERGKIGEKE